MPNDVLRQAMRAAKLTERDLAHQCGVDAKTVGRWLTDEARVPHAKHRWAAAEAVGMEEHMLWPDALRHAIKTGPDREVIAVYPYRSQCPKSVWRNLITNAKRDILLGGYTNYFFWFEQSNFGTVLRRKAAGGCRVRFLMGDPGSEVTRRREDAEAVPLTVGTRIQITLDELRKIGPVPGLQVRYGDEHIAMSVFMFDDEMLMTQHLANLVGHDSPMLHLRRMQPDGLFDRFRYHVEELWSRAREDA